MDKKMKIIHCIADVVIIGLLVWFDQFTKSLAVEKLMNKRAYVIIDNVFELNYLENRGAAFGIFENKQIMFTITGIIMLLIVMYVLIKLPVVKKYYLFEIGCVMIAAGAIGNMIDRISNGYVVDFFYFVLINFPIFNVADIYVTLSCILVAILILFVYSDSELAFLSFKAKEDKDLNIESISDEKV